MGSKGSKNKYRKVEFNSINKLSKTQKEVLYYLTEEFLTINKIANLRGTSDKAVYKIVNILIKKGYIIKVENANFIRGGQYSVTTQDNNKKEYRLHGIGLSIKILNSSPLYDRLLKIRNKDELDNNSIELYKECLVIYINKDIWGNSVSECIRKNEIYLNQLINLLQSNYKIILKTKRRCDIREFRGHIAKVNDPLARKININKEHFKIYDNNGELRLLIDKSFNYDELEAVHKDNYKRDMSKIETFYKDLLENDTIRLSEVKEHIKIFQIENSEINNNINKLLELMNSSMLIYEEKIKSLTLMHEKTTIELQQTIKLQNNLIKILTPKKNNLKEFEPSMSYLM